MAKPVTWKVKHGFQMLCKKRQRNYRRVLNGFTREPAGRKVSCVQLQKSLETHRHPLIFHKQEQNFRRARHSRPFPEILQKKEGQYDEKWKNCSRVISLKRNMNGKTSKVPKWVGTRVVHQWPALYDSSGKISGILPQWGRRCWLNEISSILDMMWINSSIRKNEYEHIQARILKTKLKLKYKRKKNSVFQGSVHF